MLFRSEPPPVRGTAYESALLVDPLRMRRMEPAPAEDNLSLVHSTDSVDEATEIQRRLTDSGITSQLQVMILVPREEAEKAYKLLEDLPGLSLAPDEDKEEEDE